MPAITEELTQQLSKNWDKVKNFFAYYHRYKIFFLKRGTGRVFVASRMDKALYISLFLKHLKRKEEVILVPADYSVIFIDDPHPKQLAYKAPKGALLVQTSPLKFQLHIPIKTTIPENHRKAYQKAAQRIFSSEYTSWCHGRKIPGFKNFKYDPPHDVEIINMLFSRSYEEFWDELEELAKGIIQTQNLKIEMNIQEAAQRLAELYIKPTNPLKSWNDFFTGDRSQADLRYATYLLSRGLSIEETLERLLQESPDILTRKKGHIEDYLVRTITKAAQYVVQNYKPITNKNDSELTQEVEK